MDTLAIILFYLFGSIVGWWAARTGRSFAPCLLLFALVCIVLLLIIEFALK